MDFSKASMRSDILPPLTGDYLKHFYGMEMPIRIYWRALS